MRRSGSFILATSLACFFSVTAACAQPKEAPKKTTNPAAEAPHPAVLPPEQFFGAAAMGYAAAKAVPEVCAKVFCYCGCDITDHHKCLLDCFTSLHGVDCHICQEEAMQTLRMDREGESLATIQRALDEGYSSKYPFKEKSPALKHYEQIRSWSPTVAGNTGGGKDDTCCAGGGSTCCAPK